jgi:hypothetical protein
MWIGMMAFIIVAAAFFCLNLLYNVVPYFTTMPPTVTMSSDLALILTALEWGVVNAVSLLTFLAIAICLFTFAIEFAYICYYYDDCSWAIPNAIIKIFEQISRALDRIFGNVLKVYIKWDRKRIDTNKQYCKEKQSELITKIKQIKQPDWL